MKGFSVSSLFAPSKGDGQAGESVQDGESNKAVESAQTGESPQCGEPNQTEGGEAPPAEEKKSKQFEDINKIAFYEAVLKQLRDDDLTDSFEALKKEINLEQSKTVKENYLFKLYTKSLYKGAPELEGDMEEEDGQKDDQRDDQQNDQIAKLKTYGMFLKNAQLRSNYETVLNLDALKKEKGGRIAYSYDITDRVELIHQHKVTCCTTNSTRNMLCSGGADHVIKICKIYENVKKRKIHTIDNKHMGKINCLKFHPVKNLLFSASDDCTIQIIDVNKLLKKKKQPFRYRRNVREKINDLSSQNVVIQDKNAFVNLYVHPCGDFLYACNRNENVVKLFDLETLSCFTSYEKKEQHHSATINCISGTSDGSLYCSVSKDGHIKIWDGHESKLVHTKFNAHNGYSVESVTFSKSNYYVLTSGLDGQTKIWDIRNFQSPFTFGNGILTCTSNRSIFMNDEHFIANVIQTNDHFTSKFFIYNAYFGNLECNLQNIHSDQISDIVNARDGLNVHTAGHDYVCKTVRIDQRPTQDGG
ncbi:Cleavage stimulation factor subunit 1-like protein [Plasmodium coatneyi]|uniref:Cleavage stimulation factor 50 kDa subunit n=1 Tax=Plasmodium coatneyi TaxID=208452 RepID=A0A1B1E1Z4_9APIC|nr:Cleavage stimulation factor subunit 1-like protein [Plasmodium coatneyi]ANQ09003.1 Cleavage stimulation factor subunit 1-like protein [Plasmodium coatneyi]